MSPWTMGGAYPYFLSFVLRSRYDIITFGAIFAEKIAVWYISKFQIAKVKIQVFNESVDYKGCISSFFEIHASFSL